MSIPRPSDWERWCDQAQQSWDYLTKTGPEMIGLAKMPTTLPDGYPSGGQGERVQAEAELTPTERAANARGFADTGEVDAHGGDDRTPPIVDDWALNQIAAGINNAKMAKAYAMRAQVCFRMVQCRTDQRVGRHQTGGDCRCCTRYVAGTSSDRLRAGYCEACYSAWRRWAETAEDAAAHDIFIRARRKEMQVLARDTTNMHNHA